MSKTLSIMKYEFKMLFSRKVSWIILLVSLIIVILDSIPFSTTINRLEFILEPSYYISRITSLNGLILTFGLMYILSNRILVDNKFQIKTIFLTTPIKKCEYIWGKTLGGLIYILTMMLIFLAISIIMYAICSPVNHAFLVFFVPVIKVLFIVILPASLFISFTSICLPVIVDIRLFYFIISILFVLNATLVGSADSMPFFALLSGDLLKTIWTHPAFPNIEYNSLLYNLLFLLLVPAISLALTFLKKGFWGDVK